MNSYSNFENIIFNLNGIIYGGYIRDKIIKTNPNDIDIYFNDKSNALLFIEKLKDYGNITKIKTNNINYTGIERLLEYKYLELDNDITILKFDISYPLDNTAIYCNSIEPPFYHLDFECNGFILDKKGLRYSISTGTYIDELEDKEKKLKISEIIYEMNNNKTRIIKENKTKHQEKYMITRIIKMMEKSTPWIILNSPFFIIKNKNKKIRCYCCDEIIDSKGVIIKNNNYSYNCFLLFYYYM
jgi:hypothetical protein